MPSIPFSSPLTFPDNSRRVLVTGAAGFIGSHTVDLLLGHGNTVWGIDDLSTGKRANVAEARRRGFRLVDEDLLASGVMDETVREFQPDAIIHLAGLVSVTLGQEIPQRNFRLNVEGTQVVAETARRHGVGRIVFASSAAVYGDLEELPLSEDAPKEPKSNYGVAKWLSELLLASYARSYGMTCVSTRFFNVFGPRQDPRSPYSGVISIFAERFARGNGCTIFGDGFQSRDFINVSDVARGLVRCATLPEVVSGAYNLCTGQRRTLLELVDVLRDRFPEAPEITFGPERSGDIRHSQGSPAKAESLLGFRAERDFGDGIGELVDSLVLPMRTAA